jgi:hypothetical protein
MTARNAVAEADLHGRALPGQRIYRCAGSAGVIAFAASYCPDLSPAAACSTRAICTHGSRRPLVDASDHPESTRSHSAHSE